MNLSGVCNISTAELRLSFPLILPRDLTALYLLSSMVLIRNETKLKKDNYITFNGWSFKKS
jgi:hypothetical protein